MVYEDACFRWVFSWVALPSATPKRVKVERWKRWTRILRKGNQEAQSRITSFFCHGFSFCLRQTGIIFHEFVYLYDSTYYTCKLRKCASQYLLLVFFPLGLSVVCPMLCLGHYDQPAVFSIPQQASSLSGCPANIRAFQIVGNVGSGCHSNLNRNLPEILISGALTPLQPTKATIDYRKDLETNKTTL